MKFLKSISTWIVAFLFCMIYSCGTVFASNNTFVMTTADFIGEPWVAILILAVGFTGVFKEIAVPGNCVGGTIAICCLGFFFGIKFMAGQADMLSIIFIVAGIILLILEAFVFPGFGFAGFAGVASICYGIVKLFDNPNEGMAVAVGIIALTSALIWALFTYVSKEKIVFEKFALKIEKEHSPSAAGEGLDVPAVDVGMTGISLCNFRPGGKALFGEDKIDVLSKGEFIEKDKLVEVIEIDGSDIFVKEVKQA